MTAQSRDVYCAWVRRALQALGPARPAAVYEWIKQHEAVPVADLSGTTSDGENLFEKNVRWARFTLRKSGVVASSARGVWALEKSSTASTP